MTPGHRMMAIKGAGGGVSQDTNITGITQTPSPCPSTHSSICTCVSVHLSAHLSVHQSICVFFSLVISLSACLSISPLCPLDILQAVCSCTIRLQGWRVNYSLVANVFGPIDFVSGSPWIRYPGSGLMALSLLNN